MPGKIHSFWNSNMQFKKNTSLLLLISFGFPCHWAKALLKMFLFLRCVSRKELGWIETKELRSQEQRGVAARTKGRETRGVEEEEQGPWVSCSHQRVSFRALLGMWKPVFCSKGRGSSFSEHAEPRWKWTSKPRKLNVKQPIYMTSQMQKYRPWKVLTYCTQCLHQVEQNRGGKAKRKTSIVAKWMMFSWTWVRILASSLQPWHSGKAILSEVWFSYCKDGDTRNFLTKLWGFNERCKRSTTVMLLTHNRG